MGDSPRRVAAVRVFPLLALLAAGGCSKPGPPPAPPEGWSVLLVTMDTVRADVLEELGAKREIVPNVEKLASRGVLWTKCETAVPLTLPSHCSILTGRHPAAHGVHHNAMYALPENVPTLASVLSGAGYQTAAFVAAYPLAPEFGTGHGFALYESGFKRDAGIRSERSAAEVNAVALPWLRARGKERFFAWVHYFDAHDPYTPAPAQAAKFPGDPYHAEVATVDAAIGELLQALEEAHQRERTLVVVLSDHGEGLGEHGEQFHGLLLYESTVHVPVVLSGGPLPAARAQLEFPTSTMDVMPTVLGLLGVPVPAGVQGVDLSGNVLGRGSVPQRPGTLSETRYAAIEYGWSPLASLRGDRLRYIEAPTPELYDLEDDPRETRNLARDQPQPAAEMQSSLQRELLQAADPQAAAAAEKSLSPEELEKLASLGYVAGGGSVDDGAVGPDPKSMMTLHDRYEQARGMLEDGKAADALPIFADLVKRDPRNLQFANKQALTLAFLGRAEEAEAAWKQIIAANPKYSMAYWDLAILQQSRGLFEDAVAVLRQLQTADPKYVGVTERIQALQAEEIATLLRQGKVDDARKRSDAILAAEPGAFWIHRVWTYYHGQAHDAASARRDLEAWLAIQPDSAEAKGLLAALP